jgi:hypothetical protein
MLLSIKDPCIYIYISSHLLMTILDMIMSLVSVMKYLFVLDLTIHEIFHSLPVNGVLVIQSNKQTS